jgi:hypothetical protein
MSSATPTILKPLASLRLTVVLFAMSVFIVFAGTLAQVDKGIWTVVHEYFRCYLTWIDFQLFFPRSWNVPGGFPFPGGWLIGALLLVNVVAAHAVRFKIQSHGPRLLLGLLVIAAGVFLSYLVLSGRFTKEVAATEDDAFWRVLWRLIKGQSAAVVLLVGCLLAFKKRAGIVLIHAGVIVMLLAELATGLWAVEGQMRIGEGDSSNFLYHTRAVELAVVDTSNDEFEDVVVVADPALRRGGLIQHDDLPFDLEVKGFMKNSKLVEPSGADEKADNLVKYFVDDTSQIKSFLLVERSEVSGTSSEQPVDTPAVHVTFKDKRDGKTLGSYLAAMQRVDSHRIEVDGKPYDVSMRWKRTYKPYTVHLIDFRHDKYLGTDTPKNYSSLVRLIDPERDVDREVKIWMNNPLRYRGETFYQSSFIGETVTILQVVRNASWMAPYLSCMIVATGLLVHFGSNLVRFLRRRFVA